MAFSSSVFIFIFLPVVFVLYFNPVFKSREYRNIILLFVSLFFYAWGEPVFIIILVISIVITWKIGLMIHSLKSKPILVLGISYHVALLFVFKYLVFVLEKIGIFVKNGSMLIETALPIGISFFTFQLMSYLFDVYYEKADAQSNLLNVGLYVSFFPQLIAGPIVRYSTIAKEINNRKETTEQFIYGMKMFITGLGKKVLIADFAAQIADNVFDYLVGNTTVGMVWLGAICFTIQIYFDFSGYSDMAVGLAKVFGFNFEPNFRYPYCAYSVTDFWRRWHISLSTWFKDYVYIPLGGNRVSKIKFVRNLFIVWLLTGLWHGPNLTFVVWGLGYFLLIIIEKFIGISSRNSILTHIYTIIAIILLWVVFRSDNIETAVLFIKSMFGFGTTGFADAAFYEYLKNSAVIICLGIVGSTPFLEKVFLLLRDTRLHFLESIWVLAVFILSLIQVVSASYNPFIYFNF